MEVILVVLEPHQREHYGWNREGEGEVEQLLGRGRGTSDSYKAFVRVLAYILSQLRTCKEYFVFVLLSKISHNIKSTSLIILKCTME